MNDEREGRGRGETSLWTLVRVLETIDFNKVVESMVRKVYIKSSRFAADIMCALDNSI